MEIFEWADVVWCQPFSELWAASIFAATRDNLKKKLIVDLDDNIWAVHPMNIGSQKGELKLIKSYFDGKFEMYWDIEPIDAWKASDYKNRIDGTVIKDQKGKVYFLRAKQPDVKLAAEFLLGAADAVTTTNEVLAQEIRKHTTKPVYVLPNCLRLSEWREPSYQMMEPFGSGWCGSYPITPTSNQSQKSSTDSWGVSATPRSNDGQQLRLLFPRRQRRQSFARLRLQRRAQRHDADVLHRLPLLQRALAGTNEVRQACTCAGIPELDLLELAIPHRHRAYRG
jgi:hypothetical protein